MVGHEVNDKVIRSWHNDNGRKGTREVVGVGCNRLVLDALKSLSELVQSVTIFYNVSSAFICLEYWPKDSNIPLPPRA